MSVWTVLGFGGSEIKIWETGYGGGVVPVEEYLVPGSGIMRELPATVLLHEYLAQAYAVTDAAASYSGSNSSSSSSNSSGRGRRQEHRGPVCRYVGLRSQ